MDKKRLFSLFDNISEEHRTIKDITINSKILLIDSTNTFLRCWARSPLQNDDGEHVGALVGFLKSIGYAIRIVKPTRCIVVFDGKGGSKRRKSIYPEYKKRSNPKSRINRAVTSLKTDNEEQIEMKRQLLRLTQYIETLPITMMCYDNVEADDVISYITTELIQDKVTIMSTDKDFLQLVSDDVSVYSPTKKKLYDVQGVKDDFGFIPKNYLISRLIDGDSSDNIKGIYGYGEAKIKKNFPFLLNENKQYTIDDFISYCKENEDENVKVYSKIIEHEEMLRLNDKLMNLSYNDISGTFKCMINDKFNEKVNTLNKVQFLKLYREHKLTTPFSDANSWLTQTFSSLNTFALKENDENS